jgi:hypothetical protein
MHHRPICFHFYSFPDSHLRLTRTLFWSCSEHRKRLFSTKTLQATHLLAYSRRHRDKSHRKRRPAGASWTAGRATTAACVAEHAWLRFMMAFGTFQSFSDSRLLLQPAAIFSGFQRPSQVGDGGQPGMRYGRVSAAARFSP